MKEKRVTKKAIFASLLSVAVCTSMLIGTSYAWFTDSVTSSNNKIVAGTLKVDLQVKGGNTGYDKYTSIKESSEPVFNYELWEPGYTVWTNVKVVNEGSLALKYTLRFVSDDDLTKAKLADAIDVYYVPEDVAAPDSRPDFTTEPYVNYYKGTLAEVFSGTVDPIEDKLEENQDADYATIVLKMKEKAGNEYQGEALPAFDLQLIAMQASYEEDTFGKDYDEKANGIPDHPEWGGLNTKASAKAVDGEDTVINGVGATLTIPAGAYDDGTAVAFEVKEGTTPGGIVIGDDNTAMTYDISVTPEETVSLKKVELNIGKGKSGLVVYHETTAMTKLTADNTTAEGYFYNPATGMLTIWSKTFSPFTIITAKPTTVAVADAVEAIEAAKSGDTVVLGEGTVALPANLPENVLIKGSTSGETKVDAGALLSKTQPVSVNFENVSFNPATGGDGRILNMKGEGTFTNCVFDNGNSWSSVYGVTQTGDVTFDGCTFKANAYACNFGTTSGTLLLKNCDFTGWNSWGDGGKIVIEDCKFHMSASYGVICSWADITISNCELDDGVQIYAHKVPKVWTINNTTKNGVKITAENIKSMFDITDSDVTDIWNICECYVDGVRVPADEA